MIQKPFRGAQLNRTHPLAKGLVGCWLFNELTGETVFDLSGYGNNGTLENGVAWYNGGLDFDGDNDYVSIGYTNFPNTFGTVEMWIKPTNGWSSSESTDDIIFEMGSAGDDRLIFYLNDDGHIRFMLYKGTAEYAYSIATTFSSKLYHLVGTFDNTGIKLYIDGISQVDGSANTISAITSARIGDTALASTIPFDGLINSVHIYNRALSAEEITWSYREPYAMFEPAFNPALLYSAAPPVGAIMNQFQKTNVGADLYNGVFA